MSDEWLIVSALSKSPDQVLMPDNQGSTDGIFFNILRSNMHAIEESLRQTDLPTATLKQDLMSVSLDELDLALASGKNLPDGGKEFPLLEVKAESKPLSDIPQPLLPQNTLSNAEFPVQPSATKPSLNAYVTLAEFEAQPMIANTLPEDVKKVGGLSQAEKMEHAEKTLPSISTQENIVKKEQAILTAIELGPKQEPEELIKLQVLPKETLDNKTNETETQRIKLDLNPSVNTPLYSKTSSTSNLGIQQQQILHQNIKDPQWQAEFSQKIVTLVKDGLQKAEIRINPPHLGVIDIKISLQNEQAQIQFTTPHQAVREVIEASLFRLRDQLGEAGIQLGQSQVSSQQAGQQQQGYDNKGHSKKDEELSQAQSLQEIVLSSPHGHLDIFV